MSDEDNQPVADRVEQVAPAEVEVRLVYNDQLDVDTEEVEPPSKQRRFLGFIKKHKISLFISGGLIVVLLALYVLIPSINIGNICLVNAGTDFKIISDQTVRLKISDVSVRVVHFTNDNCPAGRTCFGSGKKAVEYMLTIDGKDYATGSQNQVDGVGYKVETISTDYKTYANIKIVKLK